LGSQAAPHRRLQRAARHGLHHDPGQALAAGAGQHPVAEHGDAAALAREAVEQRLVGGDAERGQALGQRHEHARVGQALARRAAQRLAGVGQHVQAALDDPDLAVAGSACQRWARRCSVSSRKSRLTSPR
jgi:hypothetical protein